MHFKEKSPPREYMVGDSNPIKIKDCGEIHAAPNEQVTFVTEAGSEYDVMRKSWGFYATPSLNGRLPRMGLKPALVRNSEGKYYLFLKEDGKEAEFQAYLDSEQHVVVRWLNEEPIR